MTTHPNTGFWELNARLFIGKYPNDTTKDDAWHVELPGDFGGLSTSGRLIQGEQIPDWDSDSTGTVVKGKHCTMDFPDMPVSTHNLVISHRLRMLFESVSPPCFAQFLPLHLRYRNSTIGTLQYWVMNVLLQPDCIDESQSGPGKKHLGGKFHYWIIDPNAVPPQAMIFRAKYVNNTLLVRDELRAIIESQKMSGVGFQRPGYVEAKSFFTKK